MSDAANKGTSGWEDHPAVSTGDKLPAGDRIADKVVGGMGSWPFIIWQTVIVAGWIAFNLFAAFHHFDPYPFILLNLAFSTQAAYAAPLILIASNRSDKKASELALHTYQIDCEQLTILRTLHEMQAAQAEHNRATLELLNELVALVAPRGDT
ncbi:DUF1003 domain-containing protein [Mycolicibacterium sphagni]|nr:DUF1003 domain-containing protein [Mycolicibacterium sphagni]